MRRRFFWGMVLVAVVTLSVGGFAAAVLVDRSVDRSVRDEFARQAAATARLVESQFNAAREGDTGIDRPSAEALGEILAIVALVGGHDFVEAALITQRGVVTPLSDDPRLLGQVPDPTGVTGPVFFDAAVEGARVTALAQRLRIGDRGSILVVIGTNLEVVPWSDVVLRFLWALALGMVLAALLAGLLSGRVGRRLEELRAASRRIADGDLDARVRLSGSDEVTEVGVAFNEMAADLEEARRREREFLVSVSHDLRTPLTTIAGYAEAMDEGRVTTEEIPRVSTVLNREAERLGRLVEDLMLLSRIEAREFSLRPEPVDLAGHLKGVLEGFRGRAESARVDLTADLEDVGDVLVDPDRVDQVVGNLLENALRYTPEAGRVRLALAGAGEAVRITVADTGPGIEQADIPHIFERLYVAQHYRPVRPEGSGLGLSIVRELVDAMGGRTDVESAPGEGTRITVTIPRTALPARDRGEA